MNHDYIAEVLAQAHALTKDASCEDCPAEQELQEIRPGFHVLHVKHSETCPFYRRAKK